MNRKHADLIRLTSPVSEPADFYSGLRRRHEPAPDNLLVFVRRRARDLRPRRGGDAFHERWVLLVALAGSGEIRLDRQPVRLAPGTVVLVPPLHLHGYVNVTERIHWVFVTFEWPGHTPTAGDWTGTRRLNTAARHRLSAVVKHFLPPERDGGAAAMQLLELLHQLYASSVAATVPVHSLLTAVQAAAKAAPGESLPQLARRLGISESHLRARFRHEAGRSLGRHLRETRLREAALWLREEGLSVKAAAERAQYPNIFSFSRAFRRVLGRAPSEVKIDKTRLVPGDEPGKSAGSPPSRNGREGRAKSVPLGRKTSASSAKN